VRASICSALRLVLKASNLVCLSAYDKFHWLRFIIPSWLFAT
jgi:hypothetical protein